MAVLRRFDPDMAKVGMDEAFLDITAYLEEEYKGDGERFVSVEEWMQRREDAVRKIRATIKDETGLTVSAGIAPNKVCLQTKTGSGCRSMHLQPFPRLD